MKTIGTVAGAVAERDAHLRKIIQWHFSPETGSPFWLKQRAQLGFNPITEIQGLDDLVRLFPIFDGDTHLRKVPASDWIPRGFSDCGFWGMFETGGTTGNPKRRWGRIESSPVQAGGGMDFDFDAPDYVWDYTTFSSYLPKDGFPEGGCCVYIGPGGSRRLPLGVRVLARLRKAGITVVDMDVAWMKNGSNTCQSAYKSELTDRAIGALRRDEPVWVFCPPVLINAIGERIKWTDTSVRGVFAGGTEMNPETVRNIAEELFEGKIHLVPTYGNALVGLARPRTLATFDRPITGQRPYSVIYQPLQPRTLLRVTKPGNPQELVDYGQRGLVEITTATYEWFMPRYLERDEAERIEPSGDYLWDGVAEVGPPAELRAKLNVGVY